METLELIKRAYAANTFETSQTEAGYVNPEYWDRAVLDHVRTNTVALQFGRDRSSLMGDGDAYNITVLSEPASASSVAESASVAVVEWAPTTAVLTPTEYGIAYSITDKEMRRAFLEVMNQMVQDLGYGLGKKADALVISELQTSAGNTVVANGVVSSDVASSDTLDHIDVINAMEANEVDEFTRHIALLVNAQQGADLMKDSTFLTADKFGSDLAANRNGFMGQVLGVPVYKTQQIPVASSKSKAILISAPDAFAYGFKETGGIKTEYFARGRYTEIVGVIDFDVVTTKANAICTIESYTA